MLCVQASNALLRSARLSGASRRSIQSFGKSFLQVSDEVHDAVQTGKPVVALETTIYTHGFPYPENIALSSQLESLVRENGGIPATIGVLDGVAKVGMSSEEIIQLLETSGHPDTIKLSRRDLGFICGQGISGRKMNGGTTIAGTLVLAHLAGIKVFATGGLGGVHKGGESSMDVSADLTELGRTPMALISSGCKSFLDIPRTLEYLETQGVGVGTFADGREGNVDFPAFWTRDSGVRSPVTIEDEKQAAAILHAQLSLPLQSGLLFANPIPENYSLPKSKMDEIMAQAVRDAEEQGKTGNDNTPFVLNRIKELSDGSTIAANRELVNSNIIRGTKVAVELARLESDATSVSQTGPSGPYFYDSLRASRDKPAKVIVAGAVALDLNCDVASNVSNTVNQNPSRGTSNPAIITQSPGGVGRNVATALHYCGIDTRLCSVVGDDSDGSSVLDSIRQNGMDMTGLRIAKSKNESTGRYVAFNDMSKSLYTAMADMRILESGGPTHLKTFWEPMMKTYRPAWLIIDANWDTSTISKWSEAGRAAGAMIAYEPVSAPKSTRILFSGHLRVADLATPNIQELLVMNRSGPQWVGREPDKEAASLLKTRLKETIGTLENDLMHVIKSFWKLLPRIPCIITKLGSEGVLLSQGFWKGDPRLEHPSFSEHVFFRQSLPDANLKHDYGDGRRFGGIYVRHLLPKKMRPQDIVCVNGVGDTFLGVLIAGLSQSNPRPLEELITLAQAGAVLTLQSTESVSPKVKGLAKLLGANTST